MADNNGFTDVLRADIAQLEQELGKQHTAPPMAPYQPARGAYHPQLPDEMVQIAQSSKNGSESGFRETPTLFVDWMVETGIGHQGDISTIIGKAKSRKTFAADLFLAAMVGELIEYRRKDSRRVTREQESCCFH